MSPALRRSRAGWPFVLALAAAGTASAGTADEQYLEATALYEDGHYAAAYDRLAELADDGHPDAARMTLLMVRFGPELYATEWKPSSRRIERWLDAAIAPRRPRAAVTNE